MSNQTWVKHFLLQEYVRVKSEIQSQKTQQEKDLEMNQPYDYTMECDKSFI